MKKIRYEERTIMHTNITKKSDSDYVQSICLIFSVCLLAAFPIAAIYIKGWEDILPDLYSILTLPSPLVTDYYQLGNLASTFLNAGICGISCVIMMKLFHGEYNSTTLAGFFLVIAHCFYGLNFLNMWPPILGIAVFCYVMKCDFGDNLDMAMFSTAFGPFISELLFRYHVSDDFVVGQTQISPIGFFYTIVFSLFLGFTIPAMLPGAQRLHKGYNLFNGGLAFGLLGLFIYAYMFKTFNIAPPEKFTHENIVYDLHSRSYPEFIIPFFGVVFLIFLITGWYMNGKSFRGYGELLKSSGHRVNFFEEYGAAKVFMNIGIYGFMMLTYFTLVISLTRGNGFSGPTTGVILASITFSAQGQHPKNVWPVLMGYVVLFAFVSLSRVLMGMYIPWTLSTQAYMNGAAFATGLCPITGHYGKRFGVLAGFMCAVMCTSTSALHGGFMLYNGGLTTGITALILVPCLTYYWDNRKNA